jgi:hypothetical protein
MNYPSKIYARKDEDGCIQFSFSPSNEYPITYELATANEATDEEIIKVVDAWRNNTSLQQFRKVDQNIRGEIKKALSKYSIEEIISAINNYATVLADKDYALNYAWNIHKFLKQNNAMPDYMADGDKWVNYCKDKEKRSSKIVAWSKLDVFTQDDIRNATQLFCKNFRVPNADVQRTLSILYDVYPLVFASMCKQKKKYLDVNMKNEYGAGFFTMKFDSVIFLSPGGAITKTVNFEQELKKYQ